MLARGSGTFETGLRSEAGLSTSGMNTATASWAVTAAATTEALAATVAFPDRHRIIAIYVQPLNPAHQSQLILMFCLMLAKDFMTILQLY